MSTSAVALDVRALPSTAARLAAAPAEELVDAIIKLTHRIHETRGDEADAWREVRAVVRDELLGRLS